MRHPHSPALPSSGPPRGPLVERVAGWSAAHRKTAVSGWLLLVIAAVMAGQLLGTKNLPSYDPGQAGPPSVSSTSPACGRRRVRAC